MLSLANEIQFAMETLQMAFQQGTMSVDERLSVLENMKDAILGLQSAINSSVEYEPKEPSYVLGVLSAIQSQRTIFECGIAYGCVSGADILQLLVVNKSLILEIINSQLIE